MPKTVHVKKQKQKKKPNKVFQICTHLSVHKLSNFNSFILIFSYAVLNKIIN